MGIIWNALETGSSTPTAFDMWRTNRGVRILIADRQSLAELYSHLGSNRQPYPSLMLYNLLPTLTASFVELTFYIFWGAPPPLIKILDPPLTSYQKKKKKSSLARAPTTGTGPGALAPPPPAPPLSTPLGLSYPRSTDHRPRAFST